MKKLGLIPLAVAALMPASVVSAAGDTVESVRATAIQAAEVAATERALLVDLATDGDLDPGERAELRERVRAVDAEGQQLLGELDRLGVDVSEAVRTSLSLLPTPAPGQDPAILVPPDAVYGAAVADLTRLAETPEAAVDAGPSDSATAGLIAVAVLSLLALSVAAIVSSLRGRPEDDVLAQMAWSDGLTGLANRRRLDADLQQANDLPTTAIMVDVDHFKSINDTFGHDLGDDVLRKVSQTLSAHVRYDDVVYRYGGEEFCVLLPGASMRDAANIAERIVGAVHDITLPDGKHLTVSVGVAETVDGDTTDAVRRADQALYTAKQDGRDRAVSSPARAAVAAAHPVAV